MICEAFTLPLVHVPSSTNCQTFSHLKNLVKIDRCVSECACVCACTHVQEWVLGIELRPSSVAAGALTHQAISPAGLQFFKKAFSWSPWISPSLRGGFPVTVSQQSPYHPCSDGVNQVVDSLRSLPLDSPRWSFFLSRNIGKQINTTALLQLAVCRDLPTVGH